MADELKACLKASYLRKNAATQLTAKSRFSNYASEKSGCTKAVQRHKTGRESLMPHVIEATILAGCAKGEDVFISRIPLAPTDMPFEFKRLQFPVRLAFAMSINMAQGQSLKVA
ncbi:unnamed protein product, partial [Rotaria socialis]